MNEQLAKFSNPLEWLKIDSNNIPTEFSRISNELFNHYLIQVNENYYRLLEIEFYYDDGDKHQDPYIYGRPPQNTLGSWFFHTVGIDITFGEGNIFGGILIRSIEKLGQDEEQYTFGPWNTQQEILKSFNTNIHDGSIKFNLVPVQETIYKIKEEQPLQSQRIGLKKLDGDTDGYHSKTYRYLIRPELKHREKTQIALVLFEQSAKDKEALNKIQRLLGSEFLKQYR